MSHSEKDFDIFPGPCQVILAHPLGKLLLHYPGEFVDRRNVHSRADRKPARVDEAAFRPRCRLVEVAQDLTSHALGFLVALGAACLASVFGTWADTHPWIDIYEFMVL